MCQHLDPSLLYILKLGTENFYLGIRNTVMAEDHRGMGTSHQFSSNTFKPIPRDRITNPASHNNSNPRTVILRDLAIDDRKKRVPDNRTRGFHSIIFMFLF